MSTVAEIKQAIAKLSAEEYCELINELFPHADDDWDRQMKEDSKSGRLDFINRDVREAAAKGTLTPLEEGLEEEV